MIMLATKYFRCYQVPQLRVFFCRKDCNISIPCQQRIILGRSASARHPTHFVPARNFVRQKTTEGVSFKPDYARDGVPRTYEVIYHNGALNYFMYGIPATFIAAGIVIVGIIWIVKKRYFDNEVWDRRNAQKIVGRYTVGDPMELVFLGVPFTILLVIGTMFISRNVAVRIYHDRSTGQYMARVLHFGTYRRTMRFTRQDVQRCDTNVNVFLNGNVKVMGKSFCLIETYFRNIGDYNRLLGYDFDRASDLQRQLENEDVTKLIKRGYDGYQNEKYRSFEEKFQEKRRLRNMK